MNKKIIVPLALVALMILAMVGAASAASADDEVKSVGTVEVRGTVVELGPAPGSATLIPNTPAGDPYTGYRWDYSTFAGFWYDLDDDLKTEEMTILTGAVIGDTIGPVSYPNQQTIGEGRLVYTTSPVFQEYEMHQDIASDRTVASPMELTHAAALEQPIGLCVESDNPQGDCGYFIEGWMAEKYIAIDENADKLCKLLVEFEDDDKKTLSTGEEWDLGGGYSLTANQIDLEGDKVWFSLKKDGREIDNEVASTGSAIMQERVYTYTADIAQEDDIPVFSCYVDAVFRGTDSNVVQIMYVFLIDEDVLEIETSDTYGAMEVMTASRSRIVLRNDETTIDLDIDSTEQIMGNMYFKTADDESTPPKIRFYPYVEYTIGEGAAAAEEEEEEAPTEVVTPEANVTPTEVVTPAPEPTAAIAEETAAAPEETAAAPEEAEAAKKKTPGFEAVFAIAGLLAVAYLVLRQRE